MFLLSPSIFVWDLAILLLIAGSANMTFFCVRFLRRNTRASRLARFIATIFGILSSITCVTVMYGSFIEPKTLVVDTYDVPFPLHHALKVVVLSDLHVGPYTNATDINHVVQKVNDLFPDLILLAGDYIADEGMHAREMEALAPLKNMRATVGVFAIIGNHDRGVHDWLPGATTKEDNAEYLRSYFRTLGIMVLTNESTTINLGTEKIVLAGIDDIMSRKADLDAAMRTIPTGTPTILVSHSPDVILDTLSTKANLIVTGHTHGGQIRLPFLGPVPPLPTRLGRKYDQGIFAVDNDTTLAITRGIGESGPRARLFAWPEIMQLRLQEADTSASSSDEGSLMSSDR